jgi:hypothetical protein
MFKRKYALDKEEQEILKAFKSGKLKPLTNSKKEMEKLKASAKAFNKKH